MPGGQAALTKGRWALFTPSVRSALAEKKGVETGKGSKGEQSGRQPNRQSEARAHNPMLQPITRTG